MTTIDVSAGGRVTWRPALVFIALFAVLIASAIAVLGVGSVTVSASEVVAVVARRLRLTEGASVTVLADRIVWDLRAPRVIGAACAGTVLAVSGAVLQSLTRNELADPYLLGISSGAAAGAVCAIVFGISIGGVGHGATVGAMALLGGVAALLLVLALATGRSGELPPGRTIVSGVAVAQLAGAFTSLAIMVFGARDAAREVLAWTLGSFAGVRWPSAIALMVVAGVTVVGVLGCARALDAFAFGETSARSLGVDVARLRWILLVGTALVTAGTVAVVGPIGFVGLTVPHIVRALVGPSHTALLPVSALAGALLMVWADTAARSVADGREIPIGVVTAAIGAPVLVILLRRQAQSR
ncbi:FecCD family ABC transporter permease [Janibacter sp. GXQ6167]|uniref:FecCD family ABC transporter permease n=1 Tax=Janibacter sp. GXQ6167 TaxID=3240791 RepID=UPI0035243043